ncbi:MAG: AfsR/SARP family transcriptional regulator [Acidimicrobiia bacterium]
MRKVVVVGVLGPTCLLVDGRDPVEVERGRLLAWIALHGGHGADLLGTASFFGYDELSALDDELIGGRLPLRVELVAGRARLRGTGIGWTTDSDELCRDTAAALALLAREAWAPALRRCGRALSWWRGVPYQDLSDVVSAQAESSRLSEVLLGVDEATAAAQLGLGHSDGATARLTTIVDHAAWRQRAWRLLVLAHLSEGRYGRALAVYERCRDALVADGQRLDLATAAFGEALHRGGSKIDVGSEIRREFRRAHGDQLAVSTSAARRKA